MDESDSQKLITTGSRPEKAAAGIAPFVENCLCALGIFLVLMSGGLIVTYTGELLTGTTRHGVSSQLGLIAFLCGIVFVGYKMIQRKLNEHNALKQLKEEQLILNRAKSKGGALTVSETALDCRLAIADTKKAFERLSQSGICRIDVTDKGELCYRFPSFENTCDRSNTFILDTSEAALNLEQEKNKLV